MTTVDSGVNDEAVIRGLVENQVKAIHAKDVNKVTAGIAPDVLSFDVVNPLRYSGADKVRARAEEWFSSYQGPIGYEIRDLEVTAGEDVAFCHYLYRVAGTLTSGPKIDMWVRATSCYRRIDGEWMIAHQHQSVPFDPETGKASLDIKP